MSLKVEKRGALWVALCGSVVVFSSLDRKNVLDFITFSWNGETHE